LQAYIVLTCANRKRVIREPSVATVNRVAVLTAAPLRVDDRQTTGATVARNLIQSDTSRKLRRAKDCVGAQRYDTTGVGGVAHAKGIDTGRQIREVVADLPATAIKRELIATAATD